MPVSHPKSTPSGTVFDSASKVVVTGGSFVAAQSNITNIRAQNSAWQSFVQCQGSFFAGVLDRLYGQVATNAILNAGGRADPVQCYPGTREQVMELIDQWAFTEDTRRHRMLWLSGPAGAGKSAIVQTIAERYKDRRIQAANFFFFRADSTRNNARRFVPTLLYQILEFYPSLKKELTALFSAKPLIFDAPIQEQVDQLLFLPLHRLQVSSSRQPVVLLIDGLDECSSDAKHAQTNLLSALYALVMQDGSPFVVLLASRAEPHLIMAFNKFGSSVASIFLDEGYRPEDDIRLFVAAQFNEIRSSHHLAHTLPRQWPPASVVSSIVTKSSGQFIYAATVMRFIANSPANPELSLEKVQGLQRAARGHSPFAALDAIYTYILSQTEDPTAVNHIFSAHFVDQRAERSGLWKKIGVENMLMRYDSRYSRIVIDSGISSLLAIVRLDDGHLVFYHASLGDFLCDQSRSGAYFVDVGKFAASIAPLFFESVVDIVALKASVGLLTVVESPTPRLTEVLSRPPLSGDIEGFGVFTTMTWTMFTSLHSLYYERHIFLYKYLLCRWIIWGHSHNFSLLKPQIGIEIPYTERYFRLSRSLAGRTFLRLSVANRKKFLSFDPSFVPPKLLLQ